MAEFTIINCLHIALALVEVLGEFEERLNIVFAPSTMFTVRTVQVVLVINRVDNILDKSLWRCTLLLNHGDKMGQ